jgi:hypothetical protein
MDLGLDCGKRYNEYGSADWAKIWQVSAVQACVYHRFERKNKCWFLVEWPGI